MTLEGGSLRLQYINSVIVLTPLARRTFCPQLYCNNAQHSFIRKFILIMNIIISSEYFSKDKTLYTGRSLVDMKHKQPNT